MLGVDHDNIILLSIHFPISPILGTNCCCNVVCSILETRALLRLERTMNLLCH